MPHLFGRALEQAAASHGKERVAGKQNMVVFEPETNMAAGVARRFDDLCGAITDIDRIAFAHAGIKVRDAVLVCCRPYNFTAIALFERLIAAGMVMVVMRVQDISGFLPAFSR